MQYVIQRGKWFHFKRRIPKLYRDFYDNDLIQVSLKTDSEIVVRQRASILNHELERLWNQIATGGNPEHVSLFHQAVSIAHLGGFTYRPAVEIAKKDLGQILSRV